MKLHCCVWCMIAVVPRYILCYSARLGREACRRAGCWHFIPRTSHCLRGTMVANSSLSPFLLSVKELSTHLKCIHQRHLPSALSAGKIIDGTVRRT